MKQLKNMKETLVAATQAQLTNLENVNTQELGCAIDMIKDLSEAIYYCSIAKSMEEAKEEQEKQMEMAKYQNGGQQMMYQEEPRRMYYTEPRANPNTNSSMNQQTNGARNHQEFEYYPNPYSGRSTERRRTYMESKHLNDKSASMKELEYYAQDLTSDVIEMIEGATLEEKQMLAKKLTILANKIQSNNT